MFTLRYRTLMAFAAGLAVALIGVFALQAWRADAAPGDNDTTFIPITPCRLLDTRPQTDFNVGPRSTPIGESSPVTFTAWDSGDDDSKCEIPSSATAISTNTTIVNPTTPSFLKLYPADAALPGTSNLNYVAGQAPTPNAVTIPLSPTGAFNVYNRFGSVDVIVDINGYYTKTSLQDLDFWTSDLYRIQPFVESGYAEGIPHIQIGDAPVEVVSATLTAPSDGQVTVTADAHIFVMGGEVRLGECSISTGSKVDSGHEMYTWTPEGNHLSGVRVFDVTAGQAATFRLNCAAPTQDPGLLARNAHIAAMFTPTA